MSEQVSDGAMRAAIKRVEINDRLVKKILIVADHSDFGLSKPAKSSLDLRKYAQHDIKSLALMLVDAYDEKYDLVSIFAAAMSVIEEEAAAIIERETRVSELVVALSEVISSLDANDEFMVDHLATEEELKAYEASEIRISNAIKAAKDLLTRATKG